MRLTRLYLRNYRVYEDPVELEMPPGLVGIFGRNGAGKSTLLESITWTLWGRARTAKDQIRTSGVNADCVTEVEFEHEGHLYLVRRTISGAGHTVKAQAHADGAQVAEGVRDVARYVHSVLGMDDVAFRASVFAEQKQLAAFSSHAPADRRKLVMQLLGITPLDSARDQARRDAKATADQLSRSRGLLPDRAALEEDLAAARGAAAQARAAADASAAAASAARGDLDVASRGLEQLADVAREYESLVREGKALREQRDRAAERVGRLEAELVELEGAARRLAELSALSRSLEALERRLELVRAAVTTAAALAALPRPEAPADPVALGEGVEARRREAEAAVAALAGLDGRLSAARAALAQAEEVARKSEQLSGAADCPVCGQALGEAFERVQAHRAQEVGSAREAVAFLVAERTEAARDAEAAAQQARKAAEALESARAAWSTYERESARRLAAADAHDRAVSALGRDPGPGEDVELAQAVAEGRAAERESAALAARLERRAVVEAELGSDRERLQTIESELENLRDKVRALAFKPEELDRRRGDVSRLQLCSDEAAAESQRLAAAAAAAAATVEGHQKRLADAEEQYGRLEELGEEARHLGRLAELLNMFRNTVVASVGPRLSAQAADLFSELTDREYDRLEVDPDTYEIQIRDGGVAYGMDRFSGSETDLANLALRVAISEHVRFQSGGVVGLLVLDEVFGPLDEERKERMLLALERLRGRFRQVLVVTHAPEIKDQLPSAIEVVKLPGRRATARVLNR